MSFGEGSYVRLDEKVWTVVEPPFREHARDGRVFFIGAEDFTLAEVLGDRLWEGTCHRAGADAPSRRLPCLALHVALDGPLPVLGVASGR